MEFTDLPIPEPVMAGIRDCGFSLCTPIQALTLPHLLAGRDVAGQAQTGTGKTAAFLIALYSRMLATPRTKAAPNGPDSPRALIIAPTRELVVQVERDARALGAHTGFAIAALYGGVDYEKQKLQLSASRIDLLIGTPGRLIDFYKQKIYTVKEVEVLIIDEADRMFDMGFIADLRYLLRRLPSFEKRLSVLFSATLSYRAQELSYEYMNNPVMLAVESDVKTAAMVRQFLYHVESGDKIRLLVGILRVELAEETTAGGGRVMIFVNTKRMGEKLKDWLDGNGISAGYLSGDVPQIKRLKVLQRFQDGELPVLIATDVAGRGLHIAGVTHVINFDLPENAEDYVHRIGRTARAGAAGDAISLVDEEGAYHLEAVETFIGMKIPVSWADDTMLPELKRPPRSAASVHARPQRNERRDRKGKSISSRPVRETTSQHVDAVATDSKMPDSKMPDSKTPDKKTRRPRRAAVSRPRAGATSDAIAGAIPGEGALPAESSENPTPTPAPAKRRRRRNRRSGTAQNGSQAGTTTPELVARGSPTEDVQDS
ncbi:MAG: DEAD/DEAH box helicase [Magnetococcus sp. DMHC-1]|nr:DEAD/DEAH box helicase [Magnetococcales bacterium]MBF0155427.1 DEAD/DEAH box helicase [Magnetococcales bacterium]